VIDLNSILEEFGHSEMATVEGVLTASYDKIIEEASGSQLTLFDF